MLLRTKGTQTLLGECKMGTHRKGNLATASKIINALTFGIAISLPKNLPKDTTEKIQKIYTNICQLDYYNLQ